MLKIAADMGYSTTKGMSSTGKVKEFPSVFGVYHPIKFTTGMEQDPESNLVIGYNQKRNFVGKSALKQSKAQATVDKDRTINDENDLFAVTMINILTPDKIAESINLVVGLPVNHYDLLKEKCISSMQKTHMIESYSLTGELIRRKYITIPAVKVLPQPVGTFFDCLLNEQGEIANSSLASSKVGIIDLGYYTCDLAWIDYLDFISPQSMSFSGIGIFSIYQNLSLEIFRNYGIEIPIEHLEPLVQKGELNISGRQVSIEPLKRKAFEEAAKQIISRVKSHWPNRWNLDQIIIAGGGAILLGEYLTSEFQQAIIASNPRFSNVAGYLKFGTRVWR